MRGAAGFGRAFVAGVIGRAGAGCEEESNGHHCTNHYTT